MEMSAIYKPRRGERPLWDFPHGTLCQPRGRGVRAVARARLGCRARHDPARRPARRGRGAAVRRARPRRALLHAARAATKTASASSRCSTCSPTTPTARAATACTTRSNDADRRHRPRAHVPSGVEAAHRDLGLRRRAGARRATLDDVCRTLARARRRAARRTPRRLLTAVELESIAYAAADLLDEGFPYPDAGYRSTPWPLV